MKVLVLLGGESSEREVSLRSGSAVSAALEQAGYDVELYDPIDGLDGLTVAAKESDIVLPILHGENGEDGTIQGQLEKLGKPYLGADKNASENAYNKNTTHEILNKFDIKMPNYEVVNKEKFISSSLSKMPFVLKTVGGGSSVDLLIARQVTNENIEQGIKLIDKNEEMMLEELIDGIEITVPILDGAPLPVITVIPPKDEGFDYENKYNGKSQEICPTPVELVSLETQQRAQDLALKVHKALGIRHLSRTDMLVRPDGEFFVLELNTIPGLTNQSLFPKAAQATGISMVQLVDRFVRMVKRGE